jgi:hypothetical protein
MTTPKPPTGTRTSGRRLWAAVLEQYEFEEHELALLREIVRTVDLLDRLHAVAEVEGVTLTAADGSVRVHPAVVEARQARIGLARLQAALRLPAGEEDDGVDSRRPQRRVGVRGVYGLGGRSAS